ncbi:MAG TPA: hypothetical protein VGO00_13415 [Kofleriaceae bacterium]|nr:hypothetical protein [Kofleriaceae bacterium]
MAACTSSSTPSSVTGHSATTYLTPAGPVTRNDDLSQFQFTVFAGDDLAALPSVMGNADGTFVVPDVPAGAFMLETVGPGNLASWTQYDDHDVAITDTRIGNPDATPVSTTTPLVVDASNLTTWNDNDTLVADCFENGTEAYGIAFDPALVAGATSIAGSFDWDDPAAYSWNTTGLPYLMTAADSLVLSRITTHAGLGGRSIDVLTETMTTTGVAQADGVTATAIGSFVAVPATLSQELAIDLDGFATAMPGAATWGMAILASPGSVDNLQDGPTLVAFTGASGTGTVTTGATSYGNPFDASWPVMIYASYGTERTYTIPNKQALQHGFSSISIAAPLPGSSFTFEPSVGLVTATIDGVPIGDDRFIANDGAPLDLTVALPAGITKFDAYVTDLLSSGPGFAISSTDSTLRIPAKAFQAGHYYALRIGVIDPISKVGSFTATGKFLIGPAASSTCGDGVIDSARGETCDGTQGCSATCN